MVLDNLSTPTAAALYQTFAPAEARRIAQKLEFLYSPTHTSWLKLAVLARQCLDRRLPPCEAVTCEIRAWEVSRIHAEIGVTRRFTTDDARIKLARLYPQIA